ncbi:conserved Plasmodium protein, unknown function [Plasmodium gallinaceum]|uniref:RNA-editing substrate-binding complex 6 protein domain-containing protein n=1 Tax=Plasmodium gallinaceum TaxID=5849 RepID=A0A1J1GPC4_PLAGA|nr:conserved Plasmodium protein, unknown function [Plasmodium gallinaceum]CRG94158.1 conserved Plasmodium protein, unknown function [Plasmodium gallinaceum]
MRSILKKVKFAENGKFQRFHYCTSETTNKENSIINYKMILGLKKIEISNLSSLCRDFHNIFRIDKYQLLKYTNEILPFIKFMRTSEIVMILHHYSFINYNNFNFYNSIWNQIINRLYDIDCKELALIIYSMGKIKYINKDMILFFENEIKKWINKFSGRDCSLILKGMKNLNYNNDEIYELLHERILNISDDLNILDICIILNTHSKYKNVNLNLFEILLNKSLTYFSVINEQCIGSILWSISNANIKAEKYFSLLGLKLRSLMYEKLVKNKKIKENNEIVGENINNSKKSSKEDMHIINNEKIELNSNNNNNNQKYLDNEDVSNVINYKKTKRNTNDLSANNDNIQNNLNAIENNLNNNSDDLDDLNLEISSHNSCKYSNLLPSIIYSYGKQRTYLKYNINIDKNLYNDIINSYNVEHELNVAPVETVYLYDISKKMIKEKNVFNNANDKKNKLKKFQNKKYYQDIIYIINNYLTFFLNEVHYNDLKNILFGIAKIEMPVNKKLLSDIFELIITYVNQNMYKHYEIINLSRSLSLIPHVNSNIWKILLENYKNNFLSSTHVKNNSYLFYIFSFIKNNLNNYNFDSYLIEHINKKINSINKDDIIYLIKGLINLNYYHNELVNNISKYIEKNYENFNLIDIVYILKYFTLMNLRNTNIFSLFAKTIKKKNIKCNFELISTVASFYLEMNIFPKIIEDILIDEKRKNEKSYKTEEIQCDEE